MAVSIEFEGKVVEVPSVKTGTSSKNGNQWMSQEVVVEIPDERYPSKLAFEVFGEDKIKQYNIEQNDTVKVKANLQSNGFNGKYFTSVKAWAVTVTKGKPKPSQPAQPEPQDISTVAPASDANTQQSNSSDSDDLPF